MSPRWFNLEPIFWKLWPYLFFSTAHNFANGPHFVALTQLRPPVIQPKTPSPPLSHTYSEPPGCEDSPGGIQNIPYLYKKLSKSRFSDPFFGRFLVISGLGSQIYIVKSAILSFWVFLSTFLHEITLKAIDIDNIGCLEPFLPLWEHFWNRVSVELNCALDLTPRLKERQGFRFLHYSRLKSREGSITWSACKYMNCKQIKHGQDFQK